jgi:hypothetical protein
MASRPASFQLWKPLPQGNKGLLRFSDLLQAGFGYAEISLCAAATLGRRVSEAGRDHTLLLQALQRRIDASNADLLPGAFLDYSGDRDSVGVLTRTEQGQQDNQFELPEMGSHRHLFNYNEEMTPLQP